MLLVSGSIVKIEKPISKLFVVLVATTFKSEAYSTNYFTLKFISLPKHIRAIELLMKARYIKFFS